MLTLSKLKGWLIAAGLFIVALAAAFLKGRGSGAQSTINGVNKATGKVQRKWDKIDAQRPDFKRSIDDLRKRSKP